MIPTAVPWGFCFTVLSVLGQMMKYDANWEIMCCQVLFYQPFHVHPDPENNSRVPFKIQNFGALLAFLAQRPSAFTSWCRTDKAGRGAKEPPPEDGARTNRFDRENPVSSENSILRPRRKKLLTESPQKESYTYYV